MSSKTTELSRDPSISSAMAHRGLLIQSTVLLAINHSYESTGCDKSDEKCHLMYGTIREAQAKVTGSMPVEVRETTKGMMCDFASLKRRCGLLSVEKVVVLGLVLVNGSVDQCARIAMHIMPTVTELQFYACYQVSPVMFELECYDLAGIRWPAKVVTDNEANRCIEASFPELRSGSRGFDRSRHRQVTHRLLHGIDVICEYLKKDHVSDAVLEQVSLLVSEIQKGPTPDIELALAEKEADLQTLDILCSQWESVEILNRVLP
ncbi:LAMI_0C10880g1_1 [Lachancea mirantina]|uniref:LAMI_0C10880g1_1 n=1 Tax=Lachancea mirantina TaxID=1230905 RepID=A0A1G4J6W2_9SACH|nr:LAMI_0C10880g1_1 [Lachancea mirantina]